MSTVRGLLTSGWIDLQARRGTPTGLSELDQLTGGLVPGAMWLVMGAPGAGRTVLACQLAASAARAGNSVAFISARDPASTVLVNMLCADARVPAHYVTAGTLSTEDRGRLHRSADQLGESRLRLLTPRDQAWEFERSTASPGLLPLIGGRAPADVLVLDDGDDLLQEPLVAALPALRRWCATQEFTLVICVPEQLLMAGDRVAPEVTREADVLLRLTRPDQFDVDSPRAGEADVHVLRHRAGPQARLLVAFQGHYRRFVTLP